MFHCNEKFNVQIQPYLNKIKHVFLFLCSVVTGLPTIKAPPPSQKWVRGKQVGGGLYTLWVEAHTQWPFSHRRDCGPYSRGLKGDRWGRSHGRFSLRNVQSLASNIILYRCQIHNMFSSCAVQKVNLKQEKCHTLPHRSLCMSNKPTFYVIISNMCVFE